ncbi:hypothetical protein C0991_002958 [Blastosporella zonata]|nr:hypothetical protein C0991_002958 [Blastosporella zonata]
MPYVLSLLFLPFARSAVTNRTIDDTAGDLITGAKPIYMNVPWETPACGGCKIKPPLDDVFMQTYSALTYMQEKFPFMSIQFSFQGIFFLSAFVKEGSTAIYVYFILANNVGPEITSETLANFTLDGQLIETYHHIPTSSPDYEFNALVFSQDSLPNTNHILLISTSGVDRHLFTSFDYAKYTFDDTLITTSSQSASSTGGNSPTTTATPKPTAILPVNHSVPVGAIAGVAAGGVVLLLIAVIFFFCLRRLRHRNHPPSFGEDETTYPSGTELRISSPAPNPATSL